jgi:hypothetical protein
MMWGFEALVWGVGRLLLWWGGVLALGESGGLAAVGEGEQASKSPQEDWMLTTCRDLDGTAAGGCRGIMPPFDVPSDMQSDVVLPMILKSLKRCLC